MKQTAPFISPQALALRNRIIEQHQEVIIAIRHIEKVIEKLLREQSPRWQDLEQERNSLYNHVEPFIQQYWDWIPPVHLSRCPFCDKDLYCLFDPVDLKGFWWMDRTQRPKREPENCEHFCLLVGAVNTNQLPVQGGLFECHPGPDIPFVIPRVLNLPTMEAVVSSLQMHCGYTAYPIAYFAKTPPPIRSLTQSWAQKEYFFAVEPGLSGWDIVEDNYDYNMASWITRGKVRWVTPDGQLSLYGAAADLYPFKNVIGEVKPQVIIDNELRYEIRP